MLLEVTGLTKYFGGIAAVKGISFDVREGEIFALIGPNGAGKDQWHSKEGRLPALKPTASPPGV